MQFQAETFRDCCNPAGTRGLAWLHSTAGLADQHIHETSSTAPRFYSCLWAITGATTPPESPFNPRHLRGNISQTGKAVSSAGPGQLLGVTSEPPTGLDQHTYCSSPRNPNNLTSALGNRGDRSLCSQAQAVWHCQRRESGHLPEPGGYVTS